VRRVIVYSFFALLLSVPVKGADVVFDGGGVLSQVADGGGWATSVTLVNLDQTPSFYVLAFYGDNGQPLTLNTSAGQSNTFSGTLGPRASLIIDTAGSAATVTQGWASLLTNATIGGSAIFRYSPPTGPASEASLPLDTGANSQFALPFDHLGAATGVALVNPSQKTPLSISVVFLDQNGVTFLTDTIQMQPLTHIAFTLTERYPQTANTRGIVVLQATGTANVLGLRFRGPVFTSITPLISWAWQ
jgi:hypothetical protein